MFTDFQWVTESTLLIEGGDLGFLEERISLISLQKTSDELIVAILDGKESYKAKHQGSLTIIYPVAPAKPLNRILRTISAISHSRVVLCLASIHISPFDCAKRPAASLKVSGMPALR